MAKDWNKVKEHFIKSLLIAKERQERSLKKELMLSSSDKEKENPFEKEEKTQPFLKGKEKRIKEEFSTFWKEEFQSR